MNDAKINVNAFRQLTNFQDGFYYEILKAGIAFLSYFVRVKIFSSKHLREWDRFTIEYEPIPSIELMERAAYAIFCAMRGHLNQVHSVGILIGPGNNGGDGLALARMIQEYGCKSMVYLFSTPDQLSTDSQINFQRFERLWPEHIIQIDDESDFTFLAQHDVVLDALFGSGLNRALERPWSIRIKKLNALNIPFWSIDVPSGIPAEWTADETLNQIFIENTLRADRTYTLQQPKASFLSAEAYALTGAFHCIDIGLSPLYYQQTVCTQNWLLPEEVFPLPDRLRFSHKGTYGHGLLLAGSNGKSGAAVMTSAAALVSGIGLLSVNACKTVHLVLQQSVPQAMTIEDESRDYLTGTSVNTDPFVALAAGPGMGTESSETLFSLMAQAKHQEKPLVLDADALNMIAANPERFKRLLGPHCLLTPHPGEFDRLANQRFTSDYSRAEWAGYWAKEHHCYVLLKGAFSRLLTPDGRCFTCTRGTAALAKAGSGDVLTGVLLALVAQAPDAIEQAALRGMMIHALAGEAAEKKQGARGVSYTDLLEFIPQIMSGQCIPKTNT